MSDTGVLHFKGSDGSVVASMSVFVQGIWQATQSQIEPIQLVPEGLALSEGEAELQLLEGVRYEYALEPTALRLSLAHSNALGIVTQSRLCGLEHCGVLSPGLATGQLQLLVEGVDGATFGTAAVEVRSRKLGYKADYRQMMEDITVHCVDLLQELRAPSVFKSIPDPGRDSQTIGQRFAFVRGLLQSQPFDEALNRVTTHPHQLWEREDTEISVSRGFRPSGKILRKMASGMRRVEIPAAHPLHSTMPSLPEYVSVSEVILTEDTPENRFVKFALLSFHGFLEAMQGKVDASKDGRLAGEISALCVRLSEVLACDVMRRVSEPTFLPLGSPVLQRREGYREVLQAWLRFDMAARLVWHGGDDVYAAGQRDVATLYEYWVFFCLLDIVAEVFKLTRPASAELLKETADGFGLTLKSGKFQVLTGKSKQLERELEVRFSYNKSFRGGQSQVSQGSWTRAMRPDYTLSLWPVGFTEAEAEMQELMVHVHFDAKYRVDSVAELLGVDSPDSTSNDDSLDRQKLDEKNGTYKRADLLKMHAYRDAIRRTQGAYVLYPGDVNQPMRGYHEVLPGLGAFALRPGSGATALKAFIGEVVSHVANRSSASEQSSFHTYQTYRPDHRVEEPRALYRLFPETALGGSRERHTPPTETSVLVGWVRSAAHLQWIQKNGLYNFRTGQSVGALSLSVKAVGATYLLLHGEQGEAVSGLFRIKRGADGPRIYSKAELLALGYPTEPTQNSYLVFDVEHATEFDGYEWDYDALPGKPANAAFGFPFVTTLHSLLLAADGK